MKLNILAWNARTHVVKVFSSDQLSIDIILAAATVPFLFPAVEIKGDTYWGTATLPLRYDEDALAIVARNVETVRTR